jgi:hypothetical protein
MTLEAGKRSFFKVANDDLIKQIEILRQKMILVGMSKGFTNLETIKISQELDALLNLQMGLGQ